MGVIKLRTSKSSDDTRRTFSQDAIYQEQGEGKKRVDLMWKVKEPVGEKKRIRN